MESIEFTEEYLNKLFEDNFIEDDNLFECLKGRNGLIEVKENEMFDDDQYEGQPNTSDNFALTIKLRMQTI